MRITVVTASYSELASGPGFNNRKVGATMSAELGVGEDHALVYRELFGLCKGEVKMALAAEEDERQRELDRQSAEFNARCEEERRKREADEEETDCPF